MKEVEKPLMRCFSVTIYRIEIFLNFLHFAKEAIRLLFSKE